MRKEFLLVSLALLLGVSLGGFYFPPLLHLFWLLGPLLFMGFYDYFQTKHAIRRNFPIVGRFRYWLEAIRPEINQYFIESNSDGVPFSRELRSIVYQRAKRVNDTLPFGTQRNVYETGYEWVNHSVLATHVDPKSCRTLVGGPDCTQKYDASLMNISAMSYGALSGNAVLALNGGAKDGNFAHNTGEGGISPYHLKNGGDLIWQIGTGYFGCRREDGRFCPDRFKEKASIDTVKMIEIKISQGAKPGHGGILPGAKVTEEIASIRGVPLGKDVLSPPSHSAFSTPIELLEWIQKLRELSGGKPVGFKICVGKRREFVSICKAILKTGITPDFIVIDGGEGGTGAAPLEFSNHIGAPGIESLIFVRNALVGFNLRDRIKIISSGKVMTGFGVVRRLALGADMVYSARGMMMALGCIQALRCNANVCPAGVATQDPYLEVGLVPKDKRKRVRQFHHGTIASFSEILGAMGMNGPEDLRPWHIMRREGPSMIRHYGELYRFLEPGCLLEDGVTPEHYERAFAAASAESFRHHHE